MAILEYHSPSFKKWGENLNNILNGELDSISYVSKKFTELTASIFNAGVWSGDSANTNYNAFYLAHEALVKFSDNFGASTAEMMREYNSLVNQLETVNLGFNAMISQGNENFNFGKIKSLDAQTVTTSKVTYDYVFIHEKATELKGINDTLLSVKANLIKTIGYIGVLDPEGYVETIWAGNSANAAKEMLENTVTTYLTPVLDALKQCINNIDQAASNAEQADR